MDYYITQPKGHEITSFPEIPDFFTDIRQESCIYVAAFDTPGKDEILGLFVIRQSALDPAETDIRYIWIRPASESKQIFSAMIRYTIDLFKNMGIKSTLFRTTMTGEEQTGFFTDELAGELKLPPVKENCVFGGWYVQDFFDTEFFAGDMPKLAADPSLISMATVYSKKAERMIADMSPAHGGTVGIPDTESTFSYFYMSAGKPVAAMTARLLSDNIVLLSGFYSNDKPCDRDVFLHLVSAVLDAALEGLGLDAQVIFRFTDTSYKEILEDILGVAELAVDQKLYMFAAKEEKK